MEALLHWTERIEWVYLCHTILRGKASEREEVVKAMVRDYPHLSTYNLLEMDFPSALKMTKCFFQNIPRKIQNQSFATFLETKLNYLSAGVVQGLSFLLKISAFLLIVFGCFWLFDVLEPSGPFMASMFYFTFHSKVDTTPPSFLLHLKAQTFRRKCKTTSMSSPRKALRTLRYVWRKPGVLDQTCPIFLNVFSIPFHTRFEPTKFLGLIIGIIFLLSNGFNLLPSFFSRILWCRVVFGLTN